MTADGVAISDVDPDSPAAQIGFQKGDILVSLNREKLASSREAERLLRDRARGWEVTLDRKGRVFTTFVRG